MVLEKSRVSENFRRVSKSPRRKLESRNLKLAKDNTRLGISNFEIESPSLANQAKVLISLNRHILNEGLGVSDFTILYTYWTTLDYTRLHWTTLDYTNYTGLH